MARIVAAVLSDFSLRRAAMAASLVGAWCVLWERLSVANVVSGILVSIIVTSPGLGGSLAGGVKPLPLARLLWLIFVDLVRSTVVVSRDILTPGNHTSESIVAVTVTPAARRHLLLFTAAITLTPGTVVVDADIEAGTLYVHLLHDTDVEANTAHIHRLAELASEAFPLSDNGEAVTAATEGPA